MPLKTATTAAGCSLVAVVAVVVLSTVHHHHHPKPPVTTTTIVNSPTSTTMVRSGDCQMVGADPDPACTPGAVNPAVTQANIATTICQKGWTSTVRPSVAYTSVIKTNMMRSGTFTASYNGQTYTYKGYNVTPTYQADFEFDHVVPLEVGGAPADTKNLFPQPGGTAKFPFTFQGQPASSAQKDGWENYVNRQVCSGRLALAQGQADFLGGWYSHWVAAGKPVVIYHSGSQGTAQ